MQIYIFKHKLNLHLKFVPPGPAYFAPKPVVTHTDERKKGINFPTTDLVSLCTMRNDFIKYLVECLE
jgi:hypothetical protein